MRPRTIIRIAASLAAVLAPAVYAPAAAAQQPTVHTVRMLVEGTVPKFEPATLTIHPGDQVRFVNVNGAPHNVSFDPAMLPQDVQHALDQAMADQIQPLWGRLLVAPGDSYTISFAGVKPGRYEYFCVPHMYDRNGNMSMGMKGTIVVQ